MSPQLERGRQAREACGGCAYLNAEDAERKLGSAGRPMLHTEIRVADEDGLDPGPGGIGEILAKEIRERTGPIPEGWDARATGAKTVEWYALCLDRAR